MTNENLLSVEFASTLGDFISASATFTNASSILTIAASSFSDISRRIEVRAKELAAWEVILKDRKVVMDEMYSIREERLQREREEVDKKIAELKGLEERWKQTEALMASNMSAVTEVLTLKIGGQKFSASKTILTHHKNSYFAEMLSTTTVRQNNKLIVDRDPKHFGTLLNFLKGEKVERSVDMQGLKSEFEFYRIPFPENYIKQDITVVHRTLTLPLQITPIHKEEANRPDDPHKFSVFESELLVKWKHVIHEWLPDSHFVLAYKATQDGWSPENYHNACDFSTSTFVVIKSTEGFLFGGFTHISTKRLLLPSTFLFTLVNPHNIPPTKYALQQGPGLEFKATSTLTKHVCLGGKKLNIHDIRLSANCNVDKLSKCSFPTTFTDTTGKGELTFTGSSTFTVKEIEVLHILPMRKNWFHNTTGYMILTKQFENIIQKWLPSKTFTLQYKASRHGIKFSDFNTYLTYPLPSLILCQSTKGHVFGGYSHFLPFCSTAKHRTHPTNFIFTLTNPYTIPPTRYFHGVAADIFSQEFIEFSAMENVDCCVGGVDIVLEMAYFAERDAATCLFHFPYSFVDTTGKGSRTFTGTDRAIIRDIEVYSVL